MPMEAAMRKKHKKKGLIIFSAVKGAVNAT